MIVPQKVARYHAVARAFRDRTDRLEVSRDLLGRATKIVHAIATEAERRGWTVSAPGQSTNGYGRESWTATKDGHLLLEARGEAFWLRLHEEGVHTRGPWEAEVDRYRGVSLESLWYRDRAIPRGRYDAEASGRLKLELFCRQYWIYRGRQSRWADRQSWSLEDRLPYLFQEIEERIVEAERLAEEQRIAAERVAEAARKAAEERERQWDVLMEETKQRPIETDRAAPLRAQADAWHEAEGLRRYCDAAEAAHGDDPRTAAWLAWARAYAERLDPLTEPPTMPKPPEPTSEALQKHLPEGWSAEGPERGARQRAAAYRRP